MRALEKSLRRRIRGEVRFDDGTRAMYAVDASNYRQVPLGVVVPRSVDDVVATVATCREVGAPIVSRGGGTSLAGQTCNVAVVIDWSKYVNRIREVDVAGRLARVEPGVICDDLVHAAAPHRLTYAPDPATHTHCCFGGMLGNNSCGVHAQMAGKAVDNTEAMDVLLYDGTRLSVGWMDEAQLAARARLGGRQGDIYRRLRDLRVRYEPLIRAKYPKLLRRVSGYNLDQLLPDDQGRFNVARALVGSESTCVTILEATVRLVYNHPERVLLVLGYPDIFAAADHIPLMREYEPIGLEGIDARLIQNIQIKGGPHREYLADLPEGKGFLLVEFGADTQQEAAALAHRLMTRLERDTAPPHMKLVVDRRRQHEIWEVRESGLGATAFVPGEPATWPGWEDSAVPVDRLGDYLRDLRALYDRYDLHPALYGHFGMGCVHCRVAFELTSRTGIARYRAFMDEATDLCVRYGGSFSGEHGDGQSRAEFLAKMFGEELVGAFREFKAIWDPDGRMNPGKIVDPYRIDENLRLGADYHPAEPATHFRFPQDGGSFANATLRCVGVGKCRRLDGEGDQDTMCPSFMVTREEKHTTRGRAHALWEMLHGDVIGGGWRDGHVKEALDLCLACKGCKGDCPVNVDMATYKAEFLSHYWKGRLRPRYAYAFGLIDRWAALASVVPGLANLATQLPGLRAMAKLAAGMPAERQIPPFAPQSFQRWFRRTHPPRHAASGRTVVLWPDTFNNYFFPETARAAVDVLESGGWAVDVPRGHVCCGRPLYDYGMLDRAKRYLRDTMACLRPAIEAGTSLVVLEPSCAAVFRDELHGLFPDDPLAKRLVSQTLTLAEFLERHAADFALPRLERRAVVQGHCHQKAIMRLTADRSVLQKLGMEFEVLESGCCGMAGSFGYERDKYPVSIACGERVVLPAVRREPESTMIVADGFSCREQIAQATDRQALHLAEVIELAFDREQPPADGRPERRFTEPRRSAIRRSMWRTALAALAIAGVAGFVARSAAASWMRR